ncbi:MAG: hypothetical protein JJD93_14430 [Ilumatobacteraceae bacterium]|nr:hypothetical protein [Ilumatobacteraceae bacterium]
MRNVVLVVAVALGVLTACSSDTPTTTDAQYCTAVSANLDQLNAPSIVDPAGIDATSKLYQSITAVAPLAVQKEWETMTSVLAAAATADATDPAAVQKIADMARSSQHAATAIADYTSKVCGVTLATPTTTLPVVVETVPAP